MFDREPDFVNDIGVKWWLDDITTKHAKCEDTNGISLNATCYYVELLDGTKTRVLLSGTGEIIEEDQTLEGIAVKIDMRKFLKSNQQSEE